MFADTLNTPMSEMPSRKKCAEVRPHRDRWYCNLAPKTTRGLWLYPCMDWQRVLCARLARYRA